MKRLPTRLLAVLVLATACDSPTDTRRQVAEIVITPGDAHLAVNGTQQLTASLRDERGTPLNGVSVEWRSSNPAAVTVSPTGVVSAVAAGASEITAHAGSVSGEALVSVAVALPAECTTPVSLEVGQVFTAAAGEASVLCFDGTGAEADYTLIPFYGSTVAGATVALNVATSGTRSLAPPIGTAVAKASAVRATADPEFTRDTGWELRLRQREIRELTPLIPMARAAIPSPAAGTHAQFSTAAAVPAIGTRLTLNANAERACSDPVNRTGEVVAVTDRAIVIADIGNPAGGFTAPEYEALGRSFDDLVFPVITHNFGNPSDIDGNGRVMIFFTRAVNDLTIGNSIVGGFFFSRDLFPRSGNNQQQGCSASNQGEILYMMVPDAERSLNQAAFSKENVTRTTIGVMAHEFQHLINAAERLFSVRTGNFEETWLNEGLSHIAEELIGNHAGGFGRRENIDYERLTATDEAWDAYNMHHRSNFGRISEHLRAPHSTALFDPTAPLAARGAAWQFLRYAADRRDGAESTIWRAMVSTSTAGLNNLKNALGVDPLVWMRDWSVAVYTDDLVPGVAAQWTQPGWNYRSVLSNVRTDRTYPLAVQMLPAGGAANISVTAGGAAYLRFGVPASGRAEIRTSSGGLTPPQRLGISVVRTR